MPGDGDVLWLMLRLLVSSPSPNRGFVLSGWWEGRVCARTAGSAAVVGGGAAGVQGSSRHVPTAICTALRQDMELFSCKRELSPRENTDQVRATPKRDGEWRGCAQTRLLGLPGWPPTFWKGREGPGPGVVRFSMKSWKIPGEKGTFHTQEPSPRILAWENPKFPLKPPRRWFPARSGSHTHTWGCASCRAPICAGPGALGRVWRLSPSGRHRGGTGQNSGRSASRAGPPDLPADPAKRAGGGRKVE